MTTKTIGIKEFRAHISDYAKKAQKGKERFIVMSRNKPLFEIKPFLENEGLEQFFTEIQEARKQVKKGQVYTHDEVWSHLDKNK